MGCRNTASPLSITNSSLDSLVNSHIEKHRPAALREKIFFETMPSLELAIRHAAFASDHRDKRYAHQRRIPKKPMRRGFHLLQQFHNRIKKAESFEDLHDFLRAAISSIHGIGPLYTYDTALRLGFFLGLAPTRVHLHAGTLKGARALGIHYANVVEVSDLPEALARLSPYEIEDFLCIFKPRN